METNYREILDQYPPVITLDQMYRICHFSKRKAKWYLENGLIPCQDSGKKTRRFKINTTDVVAFLINLEKRPRKYQTPYGIFTNRQYSKPSKAQEIRKIQKTDYRNYLLDLWNELPDILTVSEIQTCTGYHKTTIIEWCTKSEVTSIRLYNKRLVTKESIIELMVRLTTTEPQRLNVKMKELAIEYAEGQNQ